MSTKAKGSTRGTLYLHVAQLRLEDAKVLLEKNRYHGSLYLAGYSVECALKWAITRRLGEVHLPAEYEIHDLQKLMGNSGLVQDLKQDTSTLVLFSALADDWSPQGRYDAARLEERKATRLYNQTKLVYS
jgi:HEPN domain-containing protein